MARLPLLVAASALLATGVSAQSSDDDKDVRVWTAVAYVNHGEKTPYFGSLQQVLSPEGAQQMSKQGSALRARYLDATGSDSNATGTAEIHGISKDAIDNMQVNVVMGEDEWVSGSAMALLQGLYPPSSEAFISAAGGDALGRNLMGNDSDATTDFPLNGYQYPKLQTLSTTNNVESPSIQGTVGCSAWSMQMTTALRNEEKMSQLANDNHDFYQDLFSSEPLKGTIDLDFAEFWYAFEIFEYVSYMYGHNQTVHDGLKNANETLTRLEDNALKLALAQNTKPEDSGSDEEMEELYTIAGRTLAMTIVQQLMMNMDSNGDYSKLGLLFGSFEPMLGILSITNVLDRENQLSGPFATFPRLGSALLIELVGDIPEDENAKPKQDDLSIRFFYRAGSDENEKLQSFSLFDSPYGGNTIPYTTFRREMLNLGVTSSRWCDLCGSTSAIWCPDSTTSSGGGGIGSGILGSNSSRIHPALAGLIGALVMGAVVTAVAIALFALGGYRVRKVAPNERVTSTHSGSTTGGGYKGKEKKAADADVSVSPMGGRQERVGSWEMRGSGEGLGITGGITLGRDEPNGYETDGISIMGKTPVNPRESV